MGKDPYIETTGQYDRRREPDIRDGHSPFSPEGFALKWLIEWIARCLRALRSK